MTDSEKQQLKQFEAKVRQLIRQYNALMAENKELKELNAQLDGTIKELNGRLDVVQQDYRNLKTARMIEVSDGDMAHAKQTITQLVREVNKCIGLLRAEQITQQDFDGKGSDVDENDGGNGRKDMTEEVIEVKMAEENVMTEKTEGEDIQPLFDMDGLIKANQEPSLFPEF